VSSLNLNIPLVGVGLCACVPTGILIAPVVAAKASDTSVSLRVTEPVLVLNAVTPPVTLNAAASQALPSQMYSWLAVVFQYIAPVSSASPSLSVAGAEDLAPR
jgi:hypothetical protein